MRSYGFYVENDFSNFHNISTFWHFLRPQNERMSSLIIHFWPTVLILSIKNGFLKIKNSIFPLEYTVKMLRKKIVKFKKIYKFTDDHFFIAVIFFLHEWKILLKIKTFGFGYEKNVNGFFFYQHISVNFAWIDFKFRKHIF